MLSSAQYSAIDYQLSFQNQKFSRAYSDAAMFGVKFFGMNELVTQSNITSSDYKTLYPLIVFNVSKPYIVDIQIMIQFTENVSANTKAFAVIISDKMLSLQSDGNKMCVVYYIS